MAFKALICTVDKILNGLPNSSFSEVKVVKHHPWHSLYPAPQPRSPSVTSPLADSDFFQQWRQQLFLLHCNLFDGNYSCQLLLTLASSATQSHMGQDGGNEENMQASFGHVLWFPCAAAWEMWTYVLCSLTWVRCTSVCDYFSSFIRLSGV